MTAGCSEEGNPSGAIGNVRLNMEVESGAITASESPGRRAPIGDGLSAEDFTVRLIPADENAATIEKPYSSFASAEGLEVASGTYTLEAFYGSADVEGIDNPYFLATTEVTVSPYETTAVDLTASLANAAVEVAASEAFLKYAASWSTQFRTSTNPSGIDYPSDATEDMYVNPGDVSLYVTLTDGQGREITLRAAEFSAKARHKYVVTLDINNGEVGDGVLSVSFDDLTVAETRDFVLSDELFNAEVPTISPNTLELTATEGSAPSEEVRFTILAESGVAAVRLTTQSAWLNAQGWPTELDLVKADSEMQVALTRLGLKTGGVWRNVGTKALLDFTDVLQAIRCTTGDNRSTFTIEVEDLLGKVSAAPAVLTYTATPFDFEITSAPKVDFTATEAKFTLKYNTASLTTSDINVEAVNSRGIFEKAEIKSCVNNSNDTYTITFAIEPAGYDIDFRVTVKGRSITHRLPREIPDFNVVTSDKATFARFTTLSLAAEGYQASMLASSATYELSSDGFNFKSVKPQIDSAGKIRLSDLTPGTDYTLRVTIGSKKSTGTFTTESALQIPNSSFEEWCQTESGKNWERIYAGLTVEEAVWGTNNPMTTSVGFDYAYDRISGTISDVGVQGNCALIRTVGWGERNTAIGNAGSWAVCLYVDAGLLHIGTSRSSRPTGATDCAGILETNDLTCGMAFPSRPQSITFWYKYTPKNSLDHGVAQIAVRNAAADPIASASYDLYQKTDFTKVTIPLTYAENADKAVLLYVKFLSTYDRKFLEKNDENLSAPPWANLSRGTYMGSQLWIDEITLNY